MNAPVIAFLICAIAVCLATAVAFLVEEVVSRQNRSVQRLRDAANRLESWGGISTATKFPEGYRSPEELLYDQDADTLEKLVRQRDDTDHGWRKFLCQEKADEVATRMVLRKRFF